MKRFFNYLWPVLLCFILGFAASKFQSKSMVEWYPTLVKSPLTPPNIAFPIAWSVLYLFIGLALGRISGKGYKLPLEYNILYNAYATVGVCRYNIVGCSRNGFYIQCKE